METHGRLCCWDYRPCFRVQSCHMHMQRYQPPLFSQSMTVQLDATENIILLSATFLSIFKRTASGPPASTTEAYLISFHCCSYVVQTRCKAPLPWDTWTHFNAWQFGLVGKTFSTFQKDNSFPCCSLLHAPLLNQIVCFCLGAQRKLGAKKRIKAHQKQGNASVLSIQRQICLEWEPPGLMCPQKRLNHRQASPLQFTLRLPAPYIFFPPPSTTSSSFLTQISHSTETHALPGSEQQCWDVLKPKSSEVQPLQMTLFRQQTIIGHSYPLQEFHKTPLKSMLG